MEVYLNNLFSKQQKMQKLERIANFIVIKE